MYAVMSNTPGRPQASTIRGLRQVLLSSLLLAVVAPDNPVSRAADATVTIRPDARHQTILGWSGMPWYPNVSVEVRDEVLDEAVNDLGLTWVHWTVPSGNRSEGRGWEWTNDDADPMHIHWPAFGTGPVDRSVRTWVLPFKQRVEARGERFGLAITQTFHKLGSTGSVPAWLLQSPAEFAEYATSLLLYLKSTHGLSADYYVICKDAGDSEDNPFEVPVVARMIKALGPRLRALGLSTTVLFPECHDANTSWRFLQAVREDNDLWPFIGMIGYHLYGGPARNTDQPKIRDFALAKGLPISHAGSDGVNLDTLYDDLTLGDVSYWSIVGLGGPGPGGAFDLHLDNTSFSRGTQYWQYRQVMQYVRPGAVRIEAVSDAPAVRPLAFVHEGRTVVVLLSNTPPQQPQSVTLRNLSPGDYGICRCVDARPYEELGVRRVDADGLLNVNLAAESVLTVYPHPGRNLPPTVVQWQAEPSFLKTPDSRIRLSAAAQDPDLDRLSYSWSLTEQPPGAKTTLADPQSATTEATGLTVPGRYVFTVAVRDGVHEVKRDVRVSVYAGNQPPLLIDVHNRLPVQVILPQSATVLRGGALDLEGDKLTFRWSVVSQPPVAGVRLETPNEGSCRVSNLTAPGDYVFKFEARDGTHTISELLTVPVYSSQP
jgi:O-glycosyl hydrolase